MGMRARQEITGELWNLHGDLPNIRSGRNRDGSDVDPLPVQKVCGVFNRLEKWKQIRSDQDYPSPIRRLGARTCDYLRRYS
jgi:hypothetical protein